MQKSSSIGLRSDKLKGVRNIVFVEDGSATKKKRKKKKGKHVYLKMSPPVALLLQVTFTLMHSIGLILSGEIIYSSRVEE